MAEMFEMMASAPPLRNDVFSFSKKKKKKTLNQAYFKTVMSKDSVIILELGGTLV
jgi:hypothetical protein